MARLRVAHHRGEFLRVQAIQIDAGLDTGVGGDADLRFVMGADPKAPIAEMVAETAAPVTVKLPVEMANQPVAPARYLHSMVMK